MPFSYITDLELFWKKQEVMFQLGKILQSKDKKVFTPILRLSVRSI